MGTLETTKANTTATVAPKTKSTTPIANSPAIISNTNTSNPTNDESPVDKATSSKTTNSNSPTPAVKPTSANATHVTHHVTHVTRSRSSPAKAFFGVVFMLLAFAFIRWYYKRKYSLCWSLF